MSDLDNRAIGCLMGQAVGDALGTRYEFKSKDKVTLEIKTDMINQHLPILGGGPFHVIKGQVTDDTELALGLARTLAHDYTFDVHNVAKAYATWFTSDPFDIGMTTRSALTLTHPTRLTPRQNYDKMIKNSWQSNQKSLSNGCLMRISPLAIAGVYWPENVLIESARLDCQLTNPSEVALDAVSVYVTAIRTAILTGDPIQAFESAQNVAQTQTIRQILNDAQDTPTPVIVTDKNQDIKAFPDSRFQGYLGVALQLAFYELLYSQSFEESLVRVISYGGDTDTNGCIVGALLGAVLGEKQIPKDWQEAVIGAKTKLRQTQYPTVKTTDLWELALILLGSADLHPTKPQLTEDFNRIDETRQR